MEFTRGLLDTVVKAAAMVTLQEQKDVEALKADHYLKAVNASKNAAVSDMVEARTSAMWAQQVVSEVRHLTSASVAQAAFCMMTQWPDNAQLRTKRHTYVMQRRTSCRGIRQMFFALKRLA